MPTAAKLVAAVMFAIVGFLAARAYVPLLPDGTDVGMFTQIMPGLGFVIGWFTLGPAKPRSYGEAISLGLRTSVFVVFWGLLGFSTYYMVLRSTKMSYDNAGQAVLDVPILMMQYGRLMGDVSFLGILAVGGALGGIVTEFARRRWR